MTIIDNDPTPTSISLSLHRTSALEGLPGGGSYDLWIDVTALIDGPSTLPRPVTVTVSVGQSGDTATESIDYSAIDRSVTIPAGSSSGTTRFIFSIIDDRLDEADETLTLSGSTSGLTVSSATLTITDDDTRGVTISETALSLKEADNMHTALVRENAPGTYTVKLTNQPTGTVLIAVASDATVATVEPATLTFTPGNWNWNTPQTVTVTPVDDTIDNPNNQRLTTITHTVRGADYGSVNADSVAVTVGGDNEMSLIMSKTTMTLGESLAGVAHTAKVAPTQDTYTVKLSGPPLESPALLLLLIETSDSSVATVGSDSQRRILFTPSN